MPFAAVLFDLDGTLVDTERESAEAMARALAAHGVPCDQEDRDYIIGRSWVAIHARLVERYTLTMSRDELIAATARAREGVFAELGVTILQGAREAVTRLGPRRALVTGSSRVEAKQALAALGLADAFQVVVAAEDVPRSKPHPDGYLLAAERLGVAIDHCLIIEDSLSGIAAGVAAGGTVVAVAAGNFAGHDQRHAHCRIATLDELTGELVDELAARYGQR